jgi:glycosyltransferase involved in cell wall biosynthesis
MLSICIPIYNNDIVALVNCLHEQCSKCKIPFEIICIDDASFLYKIDNRTLQAHPEIKYSELTQNVGRAVIRNLLAEKAIYPTLLYLDSDVSVRDNNFIKKYLECIRNKTPVAVGGITYVSIFENKNNRLHFHYGIKRESVEISVRTKNSYSSFLTGNLLIQRKLVQEIQFLSILKEYGHEDTLFCQELKKRSIPVLQIENPVVHEGLETNAVFIQKHLAAVSNLVFLIRKGYDMKGVSLYDSYLALKKYKLAGIFYFCFAPIRSISEKALKSGWTKWLTLFDALRLFEFIKQMRKNQ